MITMTLAEVAEVVGGTVAGDPRVAVTGGAFLDSREPVAGGLFVAVAGTVADGHDHAEAALAGGAAAVLGSRSTDAPTVVVPDPVAALGRLARHVLDRLPDLTVLALTGSQGKTGTKDLLATVLAGAGATVATRGNLNNELGVPITVLRADPTTRFLVVEMGARGEGHIAYLCGIAPPRVAAVLNVGSAHLGEFGSTDAIARAKGEIVEALPADGTAVLNADDPLTAAMAVRTRARTLTFGDAGDVAWRGVVLDDRGRASFEIGYAGAWHPVTLSQPGAHQVANAGAAAAMAVAVGVPLGDVAAGLTASQPASRWRMELTERDDGLLVVNDSYNANPASMTAALETVAGIGERSGRRTVAVLGEMLELGDEERSAHLGIGEVAGRLGIDVLVAVGDVAGQILEGARGVAAAGLLVSVPGRDEALTWVRNNVTASDVVLVKASRGAALEKIAEGLLSPTDQTAHQKGDPDT